MNSVQGLPLTKPQNLIYTTEKFIGGSSGTLCGCVIFGERYTVSELEKAINETVRLNDAIRTRISESGGTVTRKTDDFVYHSIVFNRFSDKSELEKHCEKMVSVPFDLSGSLYDIQAFELNGKSGIICKSHHIVCDAWSITLVASDINSLLHGVTPPAYSYELFAEKEQKYLEGKARLRDRLYFRDRFSEYDEPVFLSDKPVNDYSAKRISFFADEAFSQKIKNYAEAKGASVFNVFLTALSAYISRIKMNAEKFCIGIPFLNRTGDEDKYTAGMFVNTVPMLTEIDSGSSFSENLDKISENAFVLMRHQKFNYGDILADLRENFRFSGRLFDVIFSFQNAAFNETGLEYRWFENGRQAESLQIHIEDINMSGCFSLHYDYLTDKFDSEEITAFHNGFIRLLTNVVENDSLEIRDIEILSAAEKEKILTKFNNTGCGFDTSATLYSMFEKSARENKDKICIFNCRTTFEDFRKSAEKIDFELRKLTGNKKQVIGVCAERSAEMYSAIYGIIRGGNAYMPIDFSMPGERIEYMLENSGASIVLGSEKYKNKIRNAKFIDISTLLDGAYESISPQVSPGDTAYVIYTSGTTGTPKGAMVSHRSAVNRINWMHKKYPLMSGDVILQKTPYTFDVSVWEIFWWGIFGGSLAFAEPDRHFLPSEIVKKAELYRVTHIHFVPSVFSVFLDYAEKNSGVIQKLKSLKYIFLSGEALSPGLVKRYYAIFGSNAASLHNLYGPAECAVDVTYYDCIGDETDIPIGKPIDNTKIYITDKFLNPVPFGAVGELCIGGVGVGKGYINNAVLTNEKFIENPFGNGKIYKTGDLAHYRSDGNIMYDGRTDFQVKINGQRVETEEIKSVLLSIPEISSAEVIAKDSEKGKYLAAFYSGKKLEENELFSACSRRLPAYMIPSIFVFVDEIPVTANGKADKKFLASLEIRQPSDGDFEAPVGDIEEAICRAFSEILGIENIGRNTDFIRSGGSSIDIISFISDEKFSSITAEDFVSSPTPHGIAELLSAKKQQKNFSLLKKLKSSDSGKSIVIFPFAAGTAASFAPLSEMVCHEANCTVYFAENVRSDSDFSALADEIIELSKSSNVVLFGHCIGAQLALNIAGYAEKKGAEFRGIVACGYVPPFDGSTKNIWNFVPGKLISRLIIKAGADFGELEKNKIISDFIADTDYINSRIFKPSDKIKAPVRVITCDGDIFTKFYKKPLKNYSEYVNTVASIDVLKGGSHYFQNEKADFIVNTIKSAFDII